MQLRLLSFWSLLMLMLLGTTAEAQIGRFQNVRKFSGFKTTTTLIVLEDSSEVYNNALKLATEGGRWSITPIKYIKRSELNPYLVNPDYSMLIKNNQFKVVRRAGGNNSILRSNDIGIYRCNQGEINNYATVDAVATIRLLDVTREEQYVYKLGGLVQALHHYLQFLDAKPVSPDMHDKMVEEYFNTSNGDLAGMTLLICEDDVTETFDPSRYYAHKVEVVEQSEIQQAIAERQKGKVFLHMHPRKKYVMLISTENGHILYYEPLNKGKPLNKKNFSSISKAIKKALAELGGE